MSEQPNEKNIPLKMVSEDISVSETEQIRIKYRSYKYRRVYTTK